MCGICGIVNAGSAEPAGEDALKAMCSLIEHRGPDEEGVFVSEQGGIGARRLAVIDLQTGSQPIANEEGNIRVVSNGEIYNFRELRENLEQKGHRFRTKTDTEVIVHLYEDHGEGLLGRLRGAFAFAVWDERDNSLLLARDRVGKRPLCYALSNGKFIFASEIKSILQAPGVKREVNRLAVHDSLTWGYVPYPATAFQGIKKLPPAHFLKFKNNDIEIKRYWHLDFSRKLHLTEEEYSEAIRKSFEEAVRLRLVSDAPLGAFLSGGLDSSILTAVMSELSGSPVKTFSIGFEEEKFSELRFAGIIAKKFNTEHRELVVKPDVKNLLPKLAWHYDEPFFDSSAVPGYYLAKMAAEHVKVALNGDGGDESFAGYPRHKAARLYGYLEFLPDNVKNALGSAGNLIPAKNAILRKGRAFLRFLPENDARRHAGCVELFESEEKKTLYSDEFREFTGTRHSHDFLMGLHALSSAPGSLEKLMAADILSYLPCDLLVKMDIASMASSLETRSPFLDHKFMEFAARIPPDLKLKGFNGKYILKKAYADIIPPEILSRHKMGFGVPVSKWLREDLREMFYDNALSRKALERGYFNKESLENMASEHMSGRLDHGQKLWSLLMLELWHRAFIDGES